MKKPAHTPTKSTRGDAKSPEKGKDATTHPASPGVWAQPTAGDAQPNEEKGKGATTQPGVWAQPTTGDAQPNEDTSRKPK